MHRRIGFFGVTRGDQARAQPLRVACRVAVAFSLVVAGTVLDARAQPDSCLFDGTRYPEESRVCQNGLLQVCRGGTWQSLEGERCGEAEGADARIPVLAPPLQVPAEPAE